MTDGPSASGSALPEANLVAPEAIECQITDQQVDISTMVRTRRPG